MASPTATPPAGAYSSPCLPPEWMWQYSPEADEVYFVHPPTDQRVWEHPQGPDAETAFYQWLGSQLGAGGFSGTPPLSGAPLNRSLSAPMPAGAAGGSAADFYNSGPAAHEYPDAFSPGMPGLHDAPDGPTDRGLFTHGFGRPVKSSGWNFKLKDFFVGDFHYRPPPPRPQHLKPSHQALLGPAPGSGATHAPTFGTFKPPSLSYGRPNTYSADYLGPEPLITPFPPPAPPAAPPKPQPQPSTVPSPPPPYQPTNAGQYQHPGQGYAQGQYGGTSPRPPTFQQPHAQPQSNPYAQPNYARPPQPQQPQQQQTLSPTMNALAASPSGGGGYVPQYNNYNYAPRPPGAGGYTPGKINAGAFKPRPRGEGEDWSEQPAEWAQPVWQGSSQWGPGQGQGQGQGHGHGQWQ
ncbi:hypothetical protein CC85DRAFT_309966 [Cutaneotrichosporon oleaginosum]|uniref:WW domain-containing protein n=1 Tax=Cutaneotrichosporon oleaginosum TaxID=879819 RepID=A0A0J0XZ62_9TREE|nr:uncharacterized protein CC85DRAFT_309966 [Cutaneotrichosporon oleaginosum]KLT46331.1 hypothetical protein CC85DRAFT_309966 [Cutaneotrichosporon oleaginosum]TXT15297.1 hypothetical protein COLE_01490 [Cutaneotrichosporon oleaginosum]